MALLQIKPCENNAEQSYLSGSLENRDHLYLRWVKATSSLAVINELRRFFLLVARMLHAHLSFLADLRQVIVQDSPLVEDSSYCSGVRVWKYRRSCVCG